MVNIGERPVVGQREVLASVLAAVVVCLSAAPADGRLTGSDPTVAPSAAAGAASVATIPGWSNVTDSFGESATPAPRYDAAGAYYPRFAAWIVFGGVSASGRSLNETWIFVTGEREWFSLGSLTNTTYPTSPPALSNATIGYDSAADRLVLFGGMLATGALSNRTWVLVGSQWGSLRWSELPLGAPSPPATVRPSMAFDPVQGHLLLFDSSSGVSEWALYGNTWVVDGTTPPPVTAVVAVANDLGTRQLVLLGHSGPNSSRLETWGNAGGRWAPLATGTPLPVLFGSVLVYDLTDQYLLLLGSSGSAEETWSFGAGVWSNITSAGGSVVPDRTGELVLSDSIDATVLLYGGRVMSSRATVLGDLWAWNLPAPPPPGPYAPAPLSVETVALIGGGAAVPILVAYFLFRRPPRWRPTEVPTPLPAAG